MYCAVHVFMCAHVHVHEYRSWGKVQGELLHSNDSIPRY